MVKPGEAQKASARRLTDGRMRRRHIEAGLYFLGYVARRYWRDEALDLASSLAYTSLLSMVPLLAIGLGILGAFPGFEGLRHDLLDAVFKDLVPEVGAQVQYYMGRFAANAGRLTIFGGAGLVLTAVMLLIAIEGALNRVFRVANLRPTAKRIAVYWAALTFGPVLAGAGLTMSAWLAVLPWVRTMHHWAGRATTAGLRDAVANLTPFAALTLAFTILFLVTPNRRVRVTDAVAGGVVAALLVLALRKGFGLYIALWGSYRPVYGAVATMPIFLAWVYLSWMAVLFGAEIAAALPERRHRRRDPADGPLAARPRLALALAILSALARGTDPRGQMLHQITDAVGENERPVVEVLKGMIGRGLVARRPRNRFAVGDALAAATLADLLAALGLGLAPLANGGQEPPASHLDGLIAEAARAEAAALQAPLMDLLDLSPREMAAESVTTARIPSPLEVGLPSNAPPERSTIHR